MVWQIYFTLAVGHFRTNLRLLKSAKCTKFLIFTNNTHPSDTHWHSALEVISDISSYVLLKLPQQTRINKMRQVPHFIAILHCWGGLISTLLLIILSFTKSPLWNVIMQIMTDHVFSWNSEGFSHRRVWYITINHHDMQRNVTIKEMFQ